MSGLTFKNQICLPIFKYKQHIVEIVRQNSAVVVYGDTGVGKTTQIPQYILEANINSGLKIVITQPWRIAVISMAQRVAEEVGCVCGMEVGYDVRGDCQYNDSTMVTYMTDEILWDICVRDNTLSRYNVVIIDEAHERSLYSDIMIAILKTILNKRTDLKVVIISENDKAGKFSSFLPDAPSLFISNNIYQVVPIYEPIRRNDFVERSVNVVMKTLKNINQGDYLIFLPTENDIDVCCGRLREIENISVIKLHESMDSMEEIFANIPFNHKKVIVTNHIAETMFTIPSVRYVVDCGLTMESNYDPKEDAYVCRPKKISRDRADMRALRAGCSNKGWCYRVYRDKVYDRFAETRVPEIRRKDFWEIYAKLATMGFDLDTFEFLEPPTSEVLKKCKDRLEALREGPISLDELKEIPLDPIASKVLLSSPSAEVSNDLVIIMTMIKDQNIFETSPSPNYLIQTCHKAFHDEDGDHFTKLNVYTEFLKIGKSKKWSYLNYLKHEALLQADELCKQLCQIVTKKNMPETPTVAGNNKDIIKALILKEYYRNLCARKRPGEYVNYLTRRLLYMDPNSSLFKESPQLILYHECSYDGNRPIMYGILKIDESLLEGFPDEMSKINYKPGEIQEISGYYSRFDDPFEGDNRPDYVYVDYESDYEQYNYEVFDTYSSDDNYW